MKIGILGYGNLGRGVECAVKENPDTELVAVFTRRDPSKVKIQTPGVPVVHVDNAKDWVGKIDVMILCGGSATDLPTQTPEYAKLFNVVDSFDTHAKIPEHFANVDAADSVGVTLADTFAPESVIFAVGENCVCIGANQRKHSDAIRRVKGVKNAKQYTVPIDAALEAVRSGKNPELTTRQKHLRECYVVLEEGADAAEVENAIKTMPNYFADYDTVVNFISEEELLTKHAGLAHGGFVIRSGKTGMEKENNHIIEFNLKLDSNPEFTTSVLVAYARAAFRLNQEGNNGCKTVFDIAPAYLSAQSGEDLRAHML